MFHVLAAGERVTERIQQKLVPTCIFRFLVIIQYLFLHIVSSRSIILYFTQLLMSSYLIWYTAGLYNCRIGSQVDLTAALSDYHLSLGVTC